MYAISKGPATNKVLVKSRRSLPPRMDAFENRGNMKNRRDNYPISDINSPRHVYHNSSSGKKTYHHHHYPRESRVISPQHQEMISYIHGNWEGVMRQYESDAQLHQNIPISGKRLPRVAYYKHNDNLSRHSPKMEKPGIETVWGQRIFHNNNTNQNNNSSSNNTNHNNNSPNSPNNPPNSNNNNHQNIPHHPAPLPTPPTTRL